VQVRIFDDRLEVWNPGLLLPPLTVQKLKGKHDSIPRNPLIAKAFFWIKFAEDVGSGTSKIIQWCQEWGLPEPTYEEAGGSFVTVLHNPKPEEGEGLEKGGQRSKVKSREKSREKILRLIGENPAITTEELARTTGLSIAGVEKNIKALKQQDLLRRMGPDKGGHWEVSG
jgi:ATP-dependent DNA helicase RecG